MKIATDRFGNANLMRIGLRLFDGVPQKCCIETLAAWSVMGSGVQSKCKCGNLFRSEWLKSDDKALAKAHSIIETINVEESRKALSYNAPIMKAHARANAVPPGPSRERDIWDNTVLQGIGLFKTRFPTDVAARGWVDRNSASLMPTQSLVMEETISTFFFPQVPKSWMEPGEIKALRPKQGVMMFFGSVKVEFRGMEPSASDLRAEIEED